MKKIGILLSMAVIANVNAQSTKKGSHNYPWDSLYYQNEVAIDISPALSALLGNTEFISFAFTYKRDLTSHNALRFGYRGTLQTSSFEDQDKVLLYTVIEAREIGQLTSHLYRAFR